MRKLIYLVLLVSILLLAGQIVFANILVPDQSSCSGSFYNPPGSSNHRCSDNGWNTDVCLCKTRIDGYCTACDDTSDGFRTCSLPDPTCCQKKFWFLDFDGDGYSTSAGTYVFQCLKPANYYLAADLIGVYTDCDDLDASINPGEIEICNGVDDDCDGSIDEDNVCGCYSQTDPVYPLENVFDITDSGLLHYFPFDGNAIDRKSNTITNIVGATLTPGKFGSAYNFDGINNHIDFLSSLPNSNEMTISFWSNYKGGGNTTTIFSDFTTVPCYDFVIDMNSTNIGVRADKTGSSSPCASLNYEGSKAVGGLYLGNSWHHIAWTIASGISKIFIDGEKVIEFNETGTNNDNHAEYPSIGSWWNSPSVRDDFFNGDLDDFAIFTKALSDCEIKKIAKGPNACLVDCAVNLIYCIGVLLPNSELFSPDENNGLLYSVNITLVDSNTSKKCESKCIEGYHIEGGICVEDIDASCTGIIPNNSTLCEDDTNLIGIADDVPRSLIGNDAIACTTLKCEYYCSENYILQDGGCVLKPGIKECGNNPDSDENPNETINDSMIIGKDNYSDTEPDKNWHYSNTATIDDVCVWKCIDEYVRQGNTCVTFVGDWDCEGEAPAGTGIIVGSDKYYILNYAPKSWEYSPSATGDMNCQWKCNSGYTRYGDSCIISGSRISDVNNIEFIKLAVEDRNIIATIQCSNNLTNAAISIIDEKNIDINKDIIFITEDGVVVTNGNLDCNTSPTKYVLKEDSSGMGTYVGDQQYLVMATIPQTCSICSRSGYIFYEKDAPTTIPDANLILAGVVACFAVFVISKKRI